MSDPETLAERLAAVERAVAGETDLAAVEEAADLAGRIEALEDRLDAVEAQVADLEAATQALRGYVGNVRAVNDEVERRADAALARVETVERMLQDDGIGGSSRPVDPPPADSAPVDPPPADSAPVDPPPADSAPVDPPPVDPDAGEGWRDATRSAHRGRGDGPDCETPGEDRDGGPPPEDSTDTSGATDGSDRRGDLRAAVDRLREAL